MTGLEKLFQPISIGGMALKNRLVMPAMSTHYADLDGKVTDQLVRYYARRAQGGVGLIITEFTGVTPTGIANARQLRVSTDSHVSGLTRLAREVHLSGDRVKIALQLHHAGRQAPKDICGATPVAPSPIPSPLSGQIPHQLTKPEIEELVEAFASAADRAKQAGFDAIEVHGSHGYLISQFMSPLSNQRTDEYGNDLAGRAKFGVDVVKRIKKRCGPAFPVIFRILGDEHCQGGITPEMAGGWAKLLEEAGVDAFNVSSGSPHSPTWVVPLTLTPAGYNVPAAAIIKQAVKVPVSVAGLIKTPQQAEQILREAKADLIAMGRALIAGPDLPHQAASGRTDEIRRCITCGQCSASQGVERLGHVPTATNENVTLPQEDLMNCTVNPEVGRENLLVYRPARQPRTVLVVGAGPAGLKAATIACQRGHHVTLCEAQDRVGGQFALAAKVPYKKDFVFAIEDLFAECQRLGVKIELGTTITTDIIKQRQPDVVVMATGAKPIIPAIPGINQANVSTAHDILAGKTEAWGKVIIVGAGDVGCGTAEYLYQQGMRGIRVVEALPKLSGRDITNPRVGRAVEPLLRQHHHFIFLTTLTRIEGSKVYLADQEGKATVLEADTVVMATGAAPNRELVEAIEKTEARLFDLFTIGDCIRPDRANVAIYEGALLGSRL